MSVLSCPRLGVDLGGTKIEAIVMDRAGSARVRERCDTPRDDYEAILDAIAALVRRTAEAADVPPALPVGVGTPGAVSRKTGMMKNCNTTCLNGMPLWQDLESRLARRVRLANDADCFALSEASDGAGKDASIVFGVILGTGVGGGICIDGKLLQGPNAICGEWGHNPIPPSAIPSNGEPRACYCGQRNCVETWLSGPGFERSYRELTGVHRRASEIESLSHTGDDAAVALVDAYCGMLAVALANVVNILDPDVIVLGGGMSNMPALYENLPRRLPNHVFSDGVDTRIECHRHGDSGGVRGAAWLWPVEELYEDDGTFKNS